LRKTSTRRNCVQTLVHFAVTSSPAPLSISELNKKLLTRKVIRDGRKPEPKKLFASCYIASPSIPTRMLQNFTISDVIVVTMGTDGLLLKTVNRVLRYQRSRSSKRRRLLFLLVNANCCCDSAHSTPSRSCCALADTFEALKRACKLLLHCNIKLTLFAFCQ
jgi:hypothetical protein